VEPIAYESVLADEFQRRVVRAIAVVGIIVGFSRLLLGLYQGWLYGLYGAASPLGSANLGSGVRESMLISAVQFMLLGASLAWVASKLLTGRARAQQAVLVNELCFAGSALLLSLVRASLQGWDAWTTSSLANIAYNVASGAAMIVGLGTSLAFSLLVILILRRTNPTARGSSRDRV
jgi:hypothetical protein